MSPLVTTGYSVIPTMKRTWDNAMAADQNNQPSSPDQLSSSDQSSSSEQSSSRDQLSELDQLIPLDVQSLKSKPYFLYIFHDVLWCDYLDGCTAPGTALAIARSVDEARRIIISQYLKEKKTWDAHQSFWQDVQTKFGASRYSPDLKEKSGKTREQWDSVAPRLPMGAGHTGVWRPEGGYYGIPGVFVPLTIVQELIKMLTDATLHILPTNQVQAFYSAGGD